MMHNNEIQHLFDYLAQNWLDKILRPHGEGQDKNHSFKYLFLQ